MKGKYKIGDRVLLKKESQLLQEGWILGPEGFLRKNVLTINNKMKEFIGKPVTISDYAISPNYHFVLKETIDCGWQWHSNMIEKKVINDQLEFDF